MKNFAFYTAILTLLLGVICIDALIAEQALSAADLILWIPVMIVALVIIVINVVRMIKEKKK